MKIPVIFWRGRSFNLVNFGIFAAIGSMLGYSVCFFYLHTRGVKIERFCWEIVLALNLFNLLFAKLYAIFSIGLTNYFRNFRHFFNETSFYHQGGMIGMILGTIFLGLLLDIPLAMFGDAVCMGGIVTLLIGRVGCHHYGCCTGKPTKGRWTIRYNDPDAKICRDNPDFLNAPLIPIQLIAALLDFFIFLICVIVSIQYPFSGLIIVLFILLVNLKRFTIQKFRLKPATNKIPYRLVAFFIFVFIVLIILFFHYKGELFFEKYSPEFPFTLKNYFRFLVTDLNILASLILVAVINFVAYGIHGRRIGTHLNLSV